MATFSAADIIGKTLIAKQTIDIVRSASDNAPSVYEVKPGETIGVVQSFLLPNQNRNQLYWMFNDANGKPYYVEHGQGKFDIKTLSQQGVLTLQEKQEQAAAAAETTTDKIFRYTKNGFLIAAAAYVLNGFIQSHNKQ